MVGGSATEIALFASDEDAPPSGVGPAASATVSGLRPSGDFSRPRGSVLEQVRDNVQQHRTRRDRYVCVHRVKMIPRPHVSTPGPEHLRLTGSTTTFSSPFVLYRCRCNQSS